MKNELVGGEREEVKSNKWRHNNAKSKANVAH